MTKIITLIPTRGTILTQTQDALDRELALNHQTPIIIRTHDLALPLSRNFLVEQALKFDWTHALLLDDDVILPEGGLKELIKLKADIAIMDYPLHSLKDGKTGVGTIVHDKDGSVAWGGLGATLVKRKVFEEMKQPWFVNTNHKITRDKDGRVAFYPGQTGEMKFSGGEDVYFFLNAREKYSIKETKMIAKHAHIENVISAVHNNRYQQTHTIVVRDKIDTELI